MTSFSNEARFGDYTPSDFGWGARDPEQDSSLLVPFSHSGVSFGSMHRDVVGLFTALLDELVPFIPGGLVAGQCGCYNPNSVTVGGDRSFHTYGIAIDVNWGSNPMGASAHPTGPHTLPSNTSNIARKWGCEWGGDWTYPQDWMHIECQLTPSQASAVKPASMPTPAGKTTLEDDDMAAMLIISTAGGKPHVLVVNGVAILGPAPHTEEAAKKLPGYVEFDVEDGDWAKYVAVANAQAVGHS